MTSSLNKKKWRHLARINMAGKNDGNKMAGKKMVGKKCGGGGGEMAH